MRELFDKLVICEKPLVWIEIYLNRMECEIQLFKEHNFVDSAFLNLLHYPHYHIDDEDWKEIEAVMYELVKQNEIYL